MTTPGHGKKKKHDSVVADDESIDGRKVFRVSTNKGLRYARVVVMAIGPGNAPVLPPVSGLASATPHVGCCHAMQIKQYPPACVKARVAQRLPTNILIVGGGLTSVQLADLAIKRGVDKVWLLMRGGVKVKYFDVDLDWVGKFRNFNQAAFWSADTDQGELHNTDLAQAIRRLMHCRTISDDSTSSERG